MSVLRWRAVSLAAVVATGFGCAVIATTGASAATGCSVRYTVTSQWPGGFVAAVDLTSTGDAVAGWKLTWAYPSGQQISSAWSATVTQSATAVTATNTGYNAAIPAGGTVTFGLQGSWSGSNPAPSAFALNGSSCTGGQAPSSGVASPAASSSAPSSSAPSSSAPSSSAPASRTPSSAVPASNPVGSACPASGHITYTLSRASSPTADQSEAYRLITEGMDKAVAMYNCYTSITKALRVSYEPSVSTADGSSNGSIRFGAKSTMQQITAMHEISHTVGIGTVSAWSAHLTNGIWQGSAATAQLRALTNDQTATVHGDSQHFWPYGLNYTSEVKSTNDLIIHCKMVVALRQDMGL